MEVDNRGLEERVLDGDNEWVEWMENIRGVFFGTVLGFIRDSGGDFELDLT